MRTKEIIKDFKKDIQVKGDNTSGLIIYSGIEDY